MAKEKQPEPKPKPAATTRPITNIRMETFSDKTTRETKKKGK